MSLWYWKEKILRCALLDRWQHGFFTCNHAPSPPQTLHYLLFDRGAAFTARQVHGNTCLLVNGREEGFAESLPEADGLWAEPEGETRSVWVCSADCVPILMGDCATNAVAAIHAGWRGTAAKILPIMVQQLCDRGSQTENLRIGLGPAISGEVYQVGQDVADRVLETVGKPVGISPDSQPGHCRLDIRLIQEQQLLELGISKDHITIAPYCTLRSPDLFFSYRRHTLGQGSGSSGIQWSGIGI